MPDKSSIKDARGEQRDQVQEQALPVLQDGEPEHDGCRCSCKLCNMTEDQLARYIGELLVEETRRNRRW